MTPPATGGTLGSAHLPLRDVVATELRRLILDGTLKQGERLIEDRLCEELNLTLVQVPLIVDRESGVNDYLDRDGSRPPVRFPISNDRDLPPIDTVLVTHAHFDHLHRPSLRAVVQHTLRRRHRAPIIIVPNHVFDLVSDLGFDAVIELDWWNSYRHRGVTITHVPSRHWGARILKDSHRGYGGHVLLVFGTAWSLPDRRDLRPQLRRALRGRDEAEVCIEVRRGAGRRRTWHVL